MEKKRNKVFILVFIALITSLVGCNKYINNNSKEIIVIDEEAKDSNKDKGDISVNLIYKVKNYGEHINQSENFDNYKLMTIKQEELINFTLEVDKDEYFKYDILSVDRGEIQDEKDEEGFNIINWKEDELKGSLILNLLNNNDFRIYNNEKIYNLNNDFKLKEIEAYENINKEEIEYYIGNSGIDVISNESKYEIIDLKEEKYYKIDDIEEVLKGQYPKGDEYQNHNILSVEEDKIYLVLRDKNREGKPLFKIGYIENNKFHVIVDKEILEIEAYNEYTIGRDEAIIRGNNILFCGTVNGVSGIWNYNILTNEIALEMETKKESSISISISPDNSKLLISVLNSKENEKEELEASFGIYIGILNENLEVSKITNVTIGDASSKYFKFSDGFSEDSKNFYLKCYESNRNSISHFEIYEIVN